MKIKLLIVLNVLFVVMICYELFTDFSLQEFIMDIAYIGSILLRGD